MAVKVRTPASSANLGPGFDVMALALALHNTIEIDDRRPQALELIVTGEGEGLLDQRPATNLAVRSIATFFKEIKKTMPPLRIKMNNNIPLGRGLGSSAATIVGALVAADRLTDAGMTDDELFDLAVRIEGHPDNVAAALYGGLTVSYRGESVFKTKKYALGAVIGTALLVPAESLSTAKARAALPAQVSREDAVFNVGRAVLLIEALTAGDLDILPVALEDRLHQPHRRALVADYGAAEEICLEAGAKGVALSGAGPTLIALYDREDSGFSGRLRALINVRELKRRAIFPEIDASGATVL